MNTSGLVKYGGALVALAIVSACGGGSAGAPPNPTVNGGSALSVTGRPTTVARVNLSPLPRYEAILPDRYRAILPDHHRRLKKYEYVINAYGTYAAIFDYPRSVKEIGMINGDGGQGCTNVLYGYGKGIFWNVGGQTQITEYQVPQTPIKTLSFPYSFPTSCAMDSSGNLAVGSYGTDGGGHVLIYKNATGSPTDYATPLNEEFFDGYDNQGNLFADGFTGDRSGFALVELPKGSSKFITIKTSNTVIFPGSVQWDGTYVTVFDQLGNVTYRYTISGTTATLKSTVTYTGIGDCGQTWIVQGLNYCGDAVNYDGEVFKYPAGGSAIAILGSGLPSPYGITVAEK